MEISLPDIFYVNLEVVSDEEEPGMSTQSAAGEERMGTGTADDNHGFVDVPPNSRISYRQKIGSFGWVKNVDFTSGP